MNELETFIIFLTVHLRLSIVIINKKEFQGKQQQQQTSCSSDWFFFLSFGFRRSMISWEKQQQRIIVVVQYGYRINLIQFFHIIIKHWNPETKNKKLCGTNDDKWENQDEFLRRSTLLLLLLLFVRQARLGMFRYR